MDKLLDGKSSRRDRFVGKLFGGSGTPKERKPTSEESAKDISSFLNTADRLTVTHPVPPPPPATHPGLPALALDTSRVSRYPQANDVGDHDNNNHAHHYLPHRPQSGNAARRPNRKGHFVRFADAHPEVIGEGGDECEAVVAEIGRMKRSRSVPPSAPTQSTRQGNDYRNAQADRQGADDFVPSQIRRTQTGYTSIQDFRLQEPGPAKLQIPGQPSAPPPQSRTIPPGDAVRTRYLDDNSQQKAENRRSFIEMQQHEQREAEGMAFAKARSAHIEDEYEGFSSSPDSSRTSPPRPRQVTQGSSLPIPHAPMPTSPAHSWSSRSPAPRSPVPRQPSSVSPPTPVRSDSGRPHRSPESPGNLAPPTPPQKSASRSPSRQRQPENYVIPTPLMEQVTPFGGPMEANGASNYNYSTESPNSSYSSSVYSPDNRDTATLRSNSTRSYQAGSPERQYAGNRLQDPFNAGKDEALEIFLQRTRHLYELFRLYAEQNRPLETCRPDEFCRAALWWFLKGRTALEVVIRHRNGNSEDTRQLMARYQAYTDLSKAHWLTEEALPEIGGGRYSPMSGELGEVRMAIQHNLTKLCGSMRRNDFLPPEESFLPQTMDKSIWVEYPTLNQDIVALLNGVAGSSLAAVQQPTRTIDLLEALPIGDTPKLFNYGRVNADVYLMEQGSGASQMHLPCVVSILRPANDPQITFVVASQNNTVSLRIGADKNVGPTWQDVRWRPDMCSLEVKLPRGFLLAIQLVNKDYGMLWSIYDFGSKVRNYLYSRKDESTVYKTTLAGFHYFDSDPQSRSFPKEAISQCEMALFESHLKEGSPHGPRTFHRGFRIAVVTGPQTRTLSGVTHHYAPQLPLQFAYMRDDQQQPLLQLHFDDGKDKGRMVFRFNDDAEREKLLKLINGTYVHQDEDVIAETVLEGIQMSESLSDAKGGFAGLGRLPWQRARIVNDKYTDNPPVVLSEKLRIEIESMDQRGVGVVSTITDRINIAPGELRLRVGTKDILTLHILRQSQMDMTMSLSENLAPRELAREYAAMQSSVTRNPTVRTYRFPSFKELHTFQAAVTGYTVLFDGIAATLNVSRRRMVVPIHKKWEAGTTRIQVVQQDKTIQLLAFFEDWSHGECMGFVLKGTDTYEAFSRSGKAGLKLCEAKFPLPRVPAEGSQKTDDMAFLSLDMPEYAGENDDISIVFEDSSERDRLCSVLPAPVKGSRLSKLK